VRKGLRAILDDKFAGYRGGQGQQRDEALGHSSPSSPPRSNAVILDLSMPGRSGIESARRESSTAPSSPC